MCVVAMMLVSITANAKTKFIGEDNTQCKNEDEYEDIKLVS